MAPKGARCRTRFLKTSFAVFLLVVGRDRRGWRRVGHARRRLFAGGGYGDRVPIGCGARYRTPSLCSLGEFDTITFVVILTSHFNNPLFALRRPQEDRVDLRSFLLGLVQRLVSRRFVSNALLMFVMMMVMMLMMMASLTTGHCAPHRGPAHHSIQRTGITLSLSSPRYRFRYLATADDRSMTSTGDCYRIIAIAV